MGNEKQRPSLVIRADASAAMGTGHVMRMIALGQAWQARDGRVHFVTSCTIPELCKRLHEEAFEVHALPGAWPDHGPDLEETLSVARSAGAKWVVTDGYHFDVAYQEGVRTTGLKLLCVDDYAHLPAYQADILLNQNMGASTLPYSNPSAKHTLFGPDYAMLRKEFWSSRYVQASEVSDTLRVVVFLGGGDPDNVTLKVLQGLAAVSDVSFAVQVVLGAANPHRQEIETFVSHMKQDVTLLVDVASMKDVFADADLVFCAGGSTSWEILLLGVPSFMVCIAENQRRIIEGLVDAGAARDLGWFEALTPGKVTAALQELAENPTILDDMRSCTQSLVDGQGAKRVAAAMADILNISLVSDASSWIGPYIQRLAEELQKRGHSVFITQKVNEVPDGDIAFYLSCFELVKNEVLARNAHNLVVHESDLPQGRGWSPMTWQILEGKSEIPVTLFEAEPAVDSGPIYDQEVVALKGHELIDELREQQAEATIKLCLDFVSEYPFGVRRRRAQSGEPSYYDRRRPSDSRLDFDASLAEQFNLLRVVDNDHYPAWFEYRGHEYELTIRKREKSDS